jgi:hypothetical protein
LALGAAWLLSLEPELAGAAAAEGKLRAPVVLPGGGVADPAGKVGFVPNTSGGIDALDLATGKLLWDTKEAPRPLLATADRLFAQAPVRGKSNQVRLVVLDTAQKGKRLLESQPLSFPDWVSVGVTHGRSFASTARLGDGSLLLAWQARAWYAGGAAPTPEIERRARKAASGVMRVDLKTGKTEMLEGDTVPRGMPLGTPAEVRTATVAGRTFSLLDRPANIPGNPFQRKRTLRATDDNGKVLWERDIAAPVFLPPLP